MLKVINKVNATFKMKVQSHMVEKIIIGKKLISELILAMMQKNRMSNVMNVWV